MTYDHVIAYDKNRGILANLVYRYTEKGIIGSYFGYEGGGAYLYYFFFIPDEGDDFIVDDSPDYLFPQDIVEELIELSEVRTSFEKEEHDCPTEDGQLSEKGKVLEFDKLTSKTKTGWEYWSPESDYDLVCFLSSKWQLSIKWVMDD